MRIVLKVQRVLPAALLFLPMLTGALWLVSLPPAHGPDEEAHLEYIELLAAEREFPTLRFVPGGRDV